MQFFIPSIFLGLLAFSCNRKMPAKSSPLTSVDSAQEIVVSSAPGKKIPACIASKIDSIKARPVWNPPAEIHEYEYNGRKMYVLSAPCCDFFTTAVDETCNYVCAPAGGFTGRGDGKCSDFFKVGKHLGLIWKDERERK
jgi:hypothetical protein